MNRSLCAVAALVALLAGVACADVSDEAARSTWLASTLTDDHLVVLERDPNLVAEKYAKMRSSLYRYFRGTAPQYWRDLADPQTPYVRTAFDALARDPVVLVGDPHLENVGSFRGSDGQIWAAINDFDIARRGPFHADLRRLVTSIFVAATSIEAQFAVMPDADRWANAVIDGYVDELTAIRDGALPLLVSGDAEQGAIVDDLFRRALRDGADREELLEYTEVVEGRRVFRTADVEPNGDGFANDGIEPATPEEAAYVRALLAQASFVATPPLTVTATEVGRRWGAGVGSYPNLRYYAIVPGATLDDDVLLEVKEIRDIPSLPSLDAIEGLPFRTAGQRVAITASRYAARADGDVWLGWATDGGLSFRIRERTKYQKNIDVERIGENLGGGAWTDDDVVALGRIAGALLAQGHVAATWDGESNGRHLLALADARETLRADTLPFARAYADRIAADYLLFQDLLDTRGPLLGARVGWSQP